MGPDPIGEVELDGHPIGPRENDLVVVSLPVNPEQAPFDRLDESGLPGPIRSLGIVDVSTHDGDGPRGELEVESTREREPILEGEAFDYHNPNPFGGIHPASIAFFSHGFSFLGIGGNRPPQPQ